MTDIGIVGAGAAAAAATYVVDGAVPDASITVLEKSGGLCGRAATRRRDDVTYDYGANYLKDDDERVVDLVSTFDDGLVEVDGEVYAFDRSGAVHEGRDADERKWTYRTGLTRLAKHLFGATDATVHRRTRVESVTKEGDAWTLTDDDGEQWGSFDTLVLNPPAPQTAALLETADWESEARTDLLAATRDVDYRTVWTAVLGYEFGLDRPYYAVVNTDKEHEVGWISREECKPGHVPEGQSVLVVQANHEWSVERYDADPAENVADLAAHAATLLADDRLADPAWTDHQGWRYALPESGLRRGARTAAEEEGCYVLGDWVDGEARLHAAVRNGLDTGERLAYAL
ncbi:NAD(P)/FAD-dependent oxidoreductase [Haloplanus pelagicus]|jgi:predicted NAD/FAD-dependent oxidoreductase|uniref:NAD(P)/FAD-dependent oxidoreductase n=1 Tax=Haloplanus pelagicus TaxID=2949995 RepID=UPI0020405905|nr:NAD(P)-binding protein [Haloplanus sp. HW8-1]